MSFLYPGILYALGLAALPLIIHLINLRRHRKVFFSSLRFLQNIQKQSKRSRKIYEWLLLLARTLLIASLVLAFAGPVIKKDKIRENSNLHIVIDNTLSMEGNNENGPVYEQAKMKATEIIDLLDRNSSLSLHFLAHGNSHNSINPEQAIQKIRETPMAHGNVELSDIVKNITEKSSFPRIMVLSDFQSNILSPDTIFQDTNLYVNLIPIKNGSGNISIDSVWFNSPLQIPDQPTQLKIQISNHTRSVANELPVKIKVNGKLLSAGTTSIDPHSNTVYETSMELNDTGLLRIEANIEDLPIDFDNAYYSGIYVMPKTRVLETGEAQSKYFQAFFDDSSTFVHQFKPVNKLTITDIEQADAIILHHTSEISPGIASALVNHVESGANLIFIPEPKASMLKTNAIMELLNMPRFEVLIKDSVQIKDIDTEHAILANALDKLPKNTKLPYIGNYLKTSNTNFLTPILLSELNDPVLLHQHTENGNMYIFAFDALNRNFAMQPLFVPLFYNAATISNKNTIPEITCNKNTTLTIYAAKSDIEKSPIEIKGKGNAFIPYTYQYRNAFNLTIRQGQIPEPGFYRLQQNNEVFNMIAANHQPGESKMEFIPVDALRNQYFNLTKIAVFESNANAREILEPVKKLWRYFIALALFLILVEIALIFFKEKKL